MIINELGRCPTRLDNVYFTNNEQASLAVFTAVFWFTHAQHKCYVKLKAVNKIWSPLKISQSIIAEYSTCDRNNKGMYGCFHESKEFLGCLM